MTDVLATYLREHRDEAYALLRRFCHRGEPFLGRNAILEELDAFAAEGHGESALGAALRTAQHVAVESPWLHAAIRPRIGRWRYLRFHTEAVDVAEVSTAKFLAFQERLAGGSPERDPWPLEIDLGPFNREFPHLKESRSIGQGVSYLNRRLSSQLFRDLDNGDQRLVEFLRVHQVRGQQLMLNNRIRDVAGLRRAIRRAEDLLGGQGPDATWEDVADRLQELGFEPGWGRTVERMRDTLRLLSDILEAPAPAALEEFLGRIPMIFSVVILSPHGYFGQSNVLGLPDTGGQVVYILDQARALEKELHRRLIEQGIEIDPKILIVTRLIPEARNTTCDEPRERVTGTSHAWIVRVPFRERDGRVVPHWISRFDVWPYLERFALDAEKEVLTELGGPPALIVGNYSDGCLVASLMSRRLHVTQCNIAHALEKSKYRHSDLRWREHEDDYHFSCHFTADLIAMNTADFIITSTYQEIRGTEESVGQYEDYGAFTMPGLCRVVNGINVFDPKFNVVSPGADPDVYFPYSDRTRRLDDLRPELEALVSGAPAADHRGGFEDETKPIVFTMARLDRVKNIAGFVGWYVECPRLQDLVNVLVVGGHLDVERSEDHEEKEQIAKLHQLIDDHGLEGRLRWVEFQSERNLVGELYRFVADRRGAFVQPALFEAYGLTVVEAMSSGLPVFATRNGGPSEVIVDGVSGFHIDPHQGAAAAERMADFFERCASEPTHWEAISRGAIERVRSRYTWEIYAQRMMTLSRVYGFWKYVTNLERQETRRYLEMLYVLQFRRLAEQLSAGS